MTMQSSDYVLYKKKKYELIDCSSNLIETANFKIEKPNCHSTACHRGYTADYFIIDGILYGEKSVTIYDPNIEISIEEAFKTTTSDRMKMNYTGSIVIAHYEDEFYISDFLDCYLLAQEAYELYFIDGKLQEEINLSNIIKEWNEKEEELGVDDPLKNARRREKFAKEHLKYKYCDYKWKTKG